MTPEYEAFLKSLIEFNILLNRMDRVRRFAETLRFSQHVKLYPIYLLFLAQRSDQRGDEMDMVLSSSKAPGGWERQ